MKHNKLFNRENNRFPLTYNPENFETVQYYGITKEQIKFLIMIKEHLAGLNDFLHASNDHRFIINFVDNIISRRKYDEREIPILTELRNRFGHLYIEKTKV